MKQLLLDHITIYCFTQVIQWKGWMTEMSEYSVDPGIPYADIIVPTVDTVRASYLIELLLTNEKQVRAQNLFPLYITLHH